MTCPNCEQMLKMLEALAGPDAELARVRTCSTVTLPDDGNYTVDITTEVQEAEFDAQVLGRSLGPPVSPRPRESVDAVGRTELRRPPGLGPEVTRC